LKSSSYIIHRLIYRSFYKTTDTRGKRTHKALLLHFVSSLTYIKVKSRKRTTTTWSWG